MNTLFPTSLVGSYPQPDWLIDRKKLAGRFPPRVRAKELWRVAPEWLEQAQEDATILAIRDQERAGLDIITDGEMRRESYSNRFATALEGVDIDNPGTALDRSGHPNPVPRVTGKIRRKHAVEVGDLKFLKANVSPGHMVKMTVPGPFTMSQQAQNDFYKDPGEMALDYAAAVNEEIKDLFAAGADIVQIDEPYMQARPEKAREFGLAAVKRALDGVTGTTALHICFGYAAIIHVRPAGYSFLPELGDTALSQISIETAQSKLDTSVLAKLPGKTIILGVIDLNDMTRGERRDGRGAHPPRLAHVPAAQDHRRARLRDEVPAARRRLRQDEGDGGRRGDRPRRGRGEGGVGAGQFASTASGSVASAGASGATTIVAAGGARKAWFARCDGGQAKSSTRPATPGSDSPFTTSRNRAVSDSGTTSGAGASGGTMTWPLIGSKSTGSGAPASATLTPGSGSESEITGPTSRFLPSGPISMVLVCEAEARRSTVPAPTPVWRRISRST